MANFVAIQWTSNADFDELDANVIAQSSNASVTVSTSSAQSEASPAGASHAVVTAVTAAGVYVYVKEGADPTASSSDFDICLSPGMARVVKLSATGNKLAFVTVTPS